MWQLEEELDGVARLIDYVFGTIQGVVGDESSLPLLRPLRAP